MLDMIWGSPIQAVDGDTFDFSVTHYHKQNRYQYNNQERVRINVIDAPELPTLLGHDAKTRLWRKISGKRLQLSIHARDTFGRLVCDVGLASS